MASLSLHIVLVAILLWLSGLTIVACNCGGQKPQAGPEQCLLSHQMFNVVKIHGCYEMLVKLGYIQANESELFERKPNSTLCLDFKRHFFHIGTVYFDLSFFFFAISMFLFSFDNLVSFRFAPLPLSTCNILHQSK